MVRNRVVSIIYFDVGQKKPKIIVDNHEYLMRFAKFGETHWLCNQYYHPKTDIRCKVKVITSGKAAVVFGRHIHEPKSKMRKEGMIVDKRTRYVEDFVEIGLEERSDSKPKRKRQPNRLWIKSREFDSVEEAHREVSGQKVWKIASKKSTLDGCKVEYRCSAGKYRVKECPAGLYLLYHSAGGKVSLFSTQRGHEHDDSADLSGRGLSQHVKNFIKERFAEDTIYFDVAFKNPKIILDGNYYLVKSKELSRTIWRCSKYWKSKENRCKSKFGLPFLGTIYFDMGVKNPKIIFDNHYYIILRKECDRTIWMCSKYFNATKENRCKSKLITSGRTVQITGIHNHKPKMLHNFKNTLSQKVTICMIYFDVATKNPKIVLDDHNYLIYRKELNKTVWKCCRYFRCKDNRCKSTLVTTGRIVTVSADFHNHEPEIIKKERYKNMLSQCVTINPKIILDGHEFLIKKKAINQTTWICNHYFNQRAVRCKVKLVTSGRVVNVFGVHTHEPSRNKEFKYKNMLSQNPQCKAGKTTERNYMQDRKLTSLVKIENEEIDIVTHDIPNYHEVNLTKPEVKKRRPGRPKGSKNRSTYKAPSGVKRLRGRPRKQDQKDLGDLSFLVKNKPRFFVDENRKENAIGYTNLNALITDDCVGLFIGRQNKPRIIVQGNCFNVNKRRNRCSFWRCSSQKVTACSCTASTSSGSVVVRGAHNHDPNAGHLDFSELKSTIVVWGRYTSKNPGVIYFDVARTNPKIILNNFVYKICNKLQDRTYWKCVRYNVDKCKARITTRGARAHVVVTGFHNHEPSMVILNNFEYKLHTKKSDRTYWKCVSYKTKCRAMIISQGSAIRIDDQMHNHPPKVSDYTGLSSQQVILVNKNPARSLGNTNVWCVLGGVIWIASGTKRPKIILDGNEFTVNSGKNNRTRWRCNQYFKSKCSATLVTYGKVVKVNKYHNHPPINPPVHHLFEQKVQSFRAFAMPDLTPGFFNLGTILIGSGTKNPKIILDENEFTINTKQGARTRWRCTQYFKSKCRASLVTFGRIVKVSQFHNHPPTKPSVRNLLPQTVTIVRNRKIVLKQNMPLLNVT
ncbi:unnamed protein product [Phyllotreta striolata]|uniref:FLYWCH-type domain-containing protein n=1 Tax=Phyllotreta striolata TaxID=444603 RepID=A0A9N9XKX3_PHYSR|nr:unnamed protein product [Phyllotreta striolata]